MRSRIFTIMEESGIGCGIVVHRFVLLVSPVPLFSLPPYYIICLSFNILSPMKYVNTSVQIRCIEITCVLQ